MIITRSTWASTSHRVTVSSVVTRAPMTARGSPTTNRARWKYTLYIWGSVASNSMLTHHSFPPEPYTHHHHHHHHQHHHHHLTFWAVPPSKPGVTLARIRGHTLPLLASGPGENKSWKIVWIYYKLRNCRCSIWNLSWFSELWDPLGSGKCGFQNVILNQHQNHEHDAETITTNMTMLPTVKITTTTTTTDAQKTHAIIASTKPQH